MRCKECGFDNKVDAVFCVICGSERKIGGKNRSKNVTSIKKRQLSKTCIAAAAASAAAAIAVILLG